MGGDVISVFLPLVRMLSGVAQHFPTVLPIWARAIARASQLNNHHRTSNTSKYPIRIYVSNYLAMSEKCTDIVAKINDVAANNQKNR